MKTGKSLEDLAAELIRRKDAKKDYVAPTQKLTMEALDRPEGTDNEFERLLKMKTSLGDFRLNEIAHDQIGAHCGIPSAYYDRMRSEAPDLLATNVNRWFKDKPANRLVRTLDGTVRAFLSDRYRLIENEEIAEAVLPMLLDGPYSVMSAEITERKLYIKVVHEKVRRELAANKADRNKDIVAPAVTISNSETGHGAVSVLVGMYRHACANLSLFNEVSMKKYHLGSKLANSGEEAWQYFSSATKNLTNAAIMAQLQDTVKTAWNEEAFARLCAKVEATKEQAIPADSDIVEVVNRASKLLGVTETEQKGILNALVSGGDLSRYGLHNAITAFSQNVDSYDRATDLEKAGAAIIELPQTDWNKIIAKAA